MIGMGILSGLGGLIKGGLGLAQLIKGRRMRPERPVYEIPQEIGDTVGMRRAQLNARMAGATQAERNIRQSQATALNAARQGSTTGNQLLATAALGQAQSNRSFRNLAGQEAMDFQRRADNMARANTQMAGYRDREFQINEMQPFIDATRTRSALMQGGLMNLYGAATDASRVGGQMYAFNQMNNNPNLNPGGLMNIYLNRLSQQQNAGQGAITGIFDGLNANQGIGYGATTGILSGLNANQGYGQLPFGGLYRAAERVIPTPG